MTLRAPAAESPGVADGFDQFVRDERARLLRFAYLLSGSHAQAEDIVQEVLVRVYRRWDEVDVERGRQAYLRRAITNEFLSWRRRWSTRSITYLDPADVPDAAGPPDPLRGAADGGDRLWACLSRLPNRQRAVVVLRFYEDLTDDEIATTLGCGASTVRAHLSRALAALRQQADVRSAREDLS